MSEGLKVISDKVELYFLIALMNLGWSCSAGDMPPFPLIEYYFGDREYPIDEFFARRLEYRTLCYTPRTNATYTDVPCCSCSSDCLKNRECCIDYLWPDYASSQANVTIQGYKEYFRRHYLADRETVCAKLTSFPAKSQHFLMIISCPADAPQDSQDKIFCESDRALGPAVIAPVLGEDGYFYRNPHCARCHLNNKFTALEVSLDCVSFNSSFQSGTLFEALHKCYVTAKDGKPFECLGYDMPEQSTTAFKNVSDICAAYNGFISDQKGLIYKNIDCLKDLSPFTLVADIYHQLSINNCPQHRISLQFSVTISFGKNVELKVRDTKSGTTVYSSSVTCSSTERYDVFSSRCLPFSCGAGYARSGNQCILGEAIASNSTALEIIKQCIAAQSGGLYIATSLESNTSTSILHSILNQSLIKYKVFQSHIPTVLSRGSQIIMLGLLDSVFSINAVIQKIQQNLEIYEQLSDIYISNTNNLADSSHITDHQFILQTIFPGLALCAKSTLLDPTQVNVSNSCSLRTPQNIYSSSAYVSWIHFNASIGAEIVFVVCDGFYQHSCEGAWRLHANYTLWPNLSVTTADGSMVNFSRYSPALNGIKICESELRSTKESWKILVEEVETYVTILGITASFVAYVWVIVTFAYFMQLRTNPGKCVVSLCLSLLTSDIIFLSQLAAKDNLKVCKAMATLLHYFFLSTHAWAAVLTFDIMHTFHDANVGKNHRSWKAFTRYMAIGWLGPFSLALLGIILDASGAGDIYGKFADVCWIQSLDARLALYIVPSHTLLLICFVALATTLYKITKQRAAIADVLKSKSDHQILAKMALKLILVLGIVEIVGLAQGSRISNVSAQKGLAVFPVLFSFARGFRGVFIWIFYILQNKTVWALYKSLHFYRGSGSASSTVNLTITTKSTESVM